MRFVVRIGEERMPTGIIGIIAMPWRRVGPLLCVV